MSNLSDNSTRHAKYLAFLERCHQGKASVEHIIRLGYDLMRRAKLHHHFFANHTLQATVKYLVAYALKETDLDATRPLTPLEASKILALFEKRIEKRLPVEYLTHEAHYLGYSFYVNEDVLIPRSLMNTRFQDFLNNIQWENYRVLDLCTGSGCIGITLALIHDKIVVDLADISEKALAVAQININRYGLQNRVTCVLSDLFENISSTYDLIITNPPYVATRDYARSPAEFKTEPKLALEAGEKGLDIIDRILQQSKSYLNPKGTLIAEVGTKTAKLVKKKYRSIQFKWYKYRTPGGKVLFFAEPGVFQCHREDLP